MIPGVVIIIEVGTFFYIEIVARIIFIDIILRSKRREKVKIRPSFLNLTRRDNKVSWKEVVRMMTMSFGEGDYAFRSQNQWRGADRRWGFGASRCHGQAFPTTERHHV